MRNLNKQRAWIYTVFRNIPYTDEEWTRAMTKTRPCHAFRYGPTCETQEQARLVCERALKEAQMVSYSVYTGYYKQSVETWHCRKGGDWYQK